MLHLPTLALSLACAPVLAQGDILYGITNGSTLVRIDTATLTASAVGTVPFGSIGGLAFGIDGTLYGVETVNDTLIKIDPWTAAATSIGPIGFALTFSTGLGYDLTTDSLFTIAQGGVGASSRLVKVAKTTGAGTLIGESATNSGTAIVGLECDVAGQLWGIDGGGGHEELIKINKATAATTVVGPAGLAAYPSVGGFAIGRGGAFWAINSPATLLLINPTTGAPTVIGTLTGATLAGATGLACQQYGGVGASQAVRNGVPANPAAFLAGTHPPILGTVWNPRIDHTTFFTNATGDYLLLSPGPLNLPMQFGTLLCDLNPGVVFGKAPSADFAIPVPANPALLGGKLCTQAVSASATQFGLTNALDLTLGTF